MTKLPDKPSALIRLAIEDLEKCEASPDYVIDMEYWHVPPDEDEPCKVCLAGAVMAQTCGMSLDVCVTLLGSGKDLITPTMSALDQFRAGEWAPGLADLDIAPEKTPDGLTMFYPTPYEQARHEFKDDMLRAADIFEEAGL